MTARLTVLGDVCLRLRHVAGLLDTVTRVADAGVESLLSQTDYVVANLECPLVEMESPVEKAGPVLSSPANPTLATLIELGVRAVSLANNHSFDHGWTGLRETTVACRSAGIETFGAGENLQEAARVLIVEVQGLRVGLLGVAEREFSEARDGRPGACPANPILLHRVISNGGGWDALVVLLHAGHFLSPYPSPGLQDLCRFIIDLGAVAVVCQHSHCIGGIEEYAGGVIVYGQGNLLFDAPSDPAPEWWESLVLTLLLDEQGLAGFELVPVRQRATPPFLVTMGKVGASSVDERMAIWRSILGDRRLLEAEWGRRCQQVADDYFFLLKGRTLWARIRRVLSQRLGLRWRGLRPDRARLMANLVRCESHRETLEKILEDAAHD